MFCFMNKNCKDISSTINFLPDEHGVYSIDSYMGEDYDDICKYRIALQQNKLYTIQENYYCDSQRPRWKTIEIGLGDYKRNLSLTEAKTWLNKKLNIRLIDKRKFREKYDALEIVAVVKEIKNENKNN